MSLKSLVRPPSADKALSSRFPSHSSGFGIFSKSNRITFSRQVCMMFFGDVQILNLKGYLKNGKQYGKTLGKRPQHFVKSLGVWHRIK